MSKSSLKIKYSFQYQGNGIARCKSVSKTFAALPHNSSDPFTYGRVLNLLKRGIETVEEIEKQNKHYIQMLRRDERDSASDRLDYLNTIHI